MKLIQGVGEAKPAEDKDHSQGRDTNGEIVIEGWEVLSHPDLTEGLPKSYVIFKCDLYVDESGVVTHIVWINSSLKVSEKISIEKKPIILKQEIMKYHW